MLDRTPPPERLSQRDRSAYLDESYGYADVVGFLRCYRILIAGAMLAGLLASLVYVAFAAPIYTATAQLMLAPDMVQPVSRNAGEVTLAMDTPQIESQIAVLRSERIVISVVEKLGLLNDPEFVGRQGWLSRLGGERSPHERTRA